MGGCQVFQKKHYKLVIEYYVGVGGCQFARKKRYVTFGSSHVKSTDFWPFFHGSPQIILKFGKLVGIV